MSGVHISTGVNKRFVARVRPKGCRRFRLFKERRTLQAALRDLADGLEPYWHTGQVLMSADYYDPVVIVEVRRK